MPESVSFEELEAYHREHLERFARRIVFFSGGTVEDAEDIYAESRFKALRYFVNFKLVDDPQRVYLSWRYRIIINVWRDELRKRKGHKMVSIGSYFSDIVPSDNRVDIDTDELDLPDLEVNIEDYVSSEDERVWFWKKVESLLGRHNPVFWQCVKLRYIDGLEYEEIAKLLNCPSGTAKSRLNRAINILRSAAVAN